MVPFENRIYGSFSEYKTLTLPDYFLEHAILQTVLQ
jgi:hypothetical protein